jgi:hypothetical protein
MASMVRKGQLISYFKTLECIIFLQENHIIPKGVKLSKELT